MNSPELNNLFPFKPFILKYSDWISAPQREFFAISLGISQGAFNFAQKRPVKINCSHAFYFPPSPHVPGLGRNIAITVGRNRSYWECTIDALYACNSHCNTPHHRRLCVNDPGI
jgi:hypothetical protein